MKNLALMTLFIFGTIPAQDWGTDLATAKSEASDQDKKILIVFSGSDWCKPCIQLHRNLFESDEFEVYAKENLVLLKADFPARKKNQLSKEQTEKNETLAAQYNPDGVFPLAVFTDAEGKVLGSFGFDKTKSPEGYISEFNQYLK